MSRVAAAVAGALVLALVQSPLAWAGPPTDALREIFTGLNRALDDPGLQGKPVQLRAAIRNTLIRAFDARESARLALGNQWIVRTPAERDEFAPLLADHLERSYVFRIASRAPMQRGLLINYLAESIEASTATVRTTVASRDGGEIPVEYRMIQHGDRWAVFDVVIDGSSLVTNYRALFSRLIRQGSYAELAALMKARAASETPAGPLVAASAGATAAAAPSAAPVTASPVVPSSAVPRPAAVTRDQTEPIGNLGQRREPESTESTAPRAATPAPTTAYWLQLGAFKNSDAASELAARLRRRNLPVSIEAVTAPAGGGGILLSRVRVGPFADRTEAASKLRDLQANGYRPFLAVVRE